MKLNAAQQAVVDSNALLKVVLAGPGSGKTKTLTASVRKTGGRIAVMTFTNAGASEFRERLEDVQLYWCGTLHGFCFRLMQKFGDVLGYIPGKIGILPDKERIPRLLACRDKLGMKNMSQAALLDNKIPDFRKTMVFAEYGFLLKRNNLVDYDGILREGLEIIRREAGFRLPVLDGLFVDEYQDSAHIDQTIYDMLPAAHKMFVGDPDQSIFAFRGAFPLGLLALAAGPTEIHKLELNYRSVPSICLAANNLICQNVERVAKTIVPTKDEEGLAGVAVNCFTDVGVELCAISVVIRDEMKAPIKPSIAVLYRLRDSVKQCRDYLQAMGLPVTGPLERMPADWEKAKLLVGLTISPENDILAERYLLLSNTRSTVDRWKLEADIAGGKLHQRVRSGLDTPTRPPFGLGFLAQNGISEGTVRKIAAIAAELEDANDLTDLLHAMHGGGWEKASNDAADKIYVGTIHSAKGREFDIVFLPAFEQGIIPSMHSLREGVPSPSVPSLLEEERRLAFVGLTRARKKTYISHCETRRGQWGKLGLNEPSQFIKEMSL